MNQKNKKRNKSDNILVIDRNTRLLTSEARTVGELDDELKKQGSSFSERLVALGGPKVRLSE